MFTGIVEALGVISKVEPLDKSVSGGGGFSLTISNAAFVLVDCNLGDSISCNGVCLTVTEFNKERTWFKVGISPETIRKTNLGTLEYDWNHFNRYIHVGEAQEGQSINLERAMSGSTRFGGHFVQGHVDTCVQIHSITKDPPNSLIYHFHVPPPKQEIAQPDFLMYIVAKGYVALDGTSLTVIDVDWSNRLFSVMLIAYTQTRVVMTQKQVSSSVNLEVDQMGKYVENMISGMATAGKGPIHDLVEKIIEQKLAKADV